jgi:hypothetical protein
MFRFFRSVFMPQFLGFSNFAVFGNMIFQAFFFWLLGFVRKYCVDGIRQSFVLYTVFVELCLYIFFLCECY